MNPLPDEPNILDGLLDEWLGQKRPRSLHVDALARREYSSERLAELDSALKSARQDKNRLTPAHVDESRRSNKFHVRWYTLATMAAGIALAVVGWTWLDQRRSKDPVNDGPSGLAAVASPNESASKTGVESKSTTQIEAAAPPKSNLASSEPASGEAKSNNNDKPRSERVSLSLDTVPFANKAADASSIDRQAPRSKVEPLSESEVIALIDRSMKEWWNQYGVQPLPAVSGSEWVTRASQRLVGRSPSGAELERFSKKDSPAARTEWIHQATGSLEFPRYWGKRLTAFYFGESITQVAEVNAERREFVKWCQNEFKRTGMRSDALTNKLLKLNIAASDKSAFAPDHYWWSENGKRGNQYVADLISTRFMERRGACDRCHVSKTVAGADQAKYWGLAAVTRGVKAEQSADDLSKWSVSYRESAEPMFYERADATMVAVAPTLPNGKVLQELANRNDRDVRAAEQNLHALADWLTTSDEFARSQVNLAWEVLFGVPLADATPIDEKDANSERRALLNALGRQLIANDFDMRRLATWLTSSQAFARQSNDMNAAWYTAAGEKEMDQAHRRQALLAAFPVTTDPNMRSMNKLVALNEQILPSPSGQSGVLAQPVLPTNPGKAMANAAAKNANREKLSKLSPGQIQYLVNVYTLPETFEIEIDRLLKTKLPWEQLVEHAFLMTGGRGPSQRELEASQRLLELTRDRRQALHRIIAGRL